MIKYKYILFLLNLSEQTAPGENPIFIFRTLLGEAAPVISRQLELLNLLSGGFAEGGEVVVPQVQVGQIREMLQAD